MLIQDWASSRNQKEVKLHLGCGSKYLDGWCNIDEYKPADTDTHRGNMSREPDIWCDITNLPTPDDSVDIILTQHVIEHFYRHQVIELLKEFKRVLKPGGVVITEMPDLGRILFLLWLLPKKPLYPPAMGANRDMVKSQLYGAAWEKNDLGYQCHKYVWERREFEQVLLDTGLEIVLSSGATKSHVPFRDMVVIAKKQLGALSDNYYSSNDATSLIKSYGFCAARIVKQLKSICFLFAKGLR